MRKLHKTLMKWGSAMAKVSLAASIQHSNDANMPLVDGYATDDIIKITGFKIHPRFQK